MGVIGLACNGHDKYISLQQRANDPNPKDVKDYSSGGVIGQQELMDLMDANHTLMQAGGGVKQVSAGAYTMVSLFDRWSLKELSGVVMIKDNNGKQTAATANPVAIFEDLTFPITVMAEVNGYTSQIVLQTQANLIAFGMEQIVDQIETVYGLGASSFINQHHPVGWITESMNTQGELDAVKRINLSRGTAPVNAATQYPVCLLATDSLRPAGVVSFLSTIGGDTGNQLWKYTGYAYTDLGLLESNGLMPPSTETFLLNFNDITLLNKYTGGTYTIPSWGKPISSSAVPILHFEGGTSVARTWEFIPTTVPFAINAGEQSGTYAMDGVDLPVPGDRPAVRASIAYPTGGVETQFINWDPTDTIAPAVAFNALPVIDSVTSTTNSGQGFVLNASWTNTPAEGLLALDMCSGSSVMCRIILTSDADSVPQDMVIRVPIQLSPERMSPQVDQNLLSRNRNQRMG